jgi:intracellular septation protein
VLYGLFALVLGAGRLFFGRNLIRSAMSKQLALPDDVWGRLNSAWMVFFAAMAVLNLYVAYGFSTDVWVDFKLFGTLGLTLLFVVAQAFYVGRFVQEEG